MWEREIAKDGEKLRQVVREKEKKRQSKSEKGKDKVGERERKRERKRQIMKGIVIKLSIVQKTIKRIKIMRNRRGRERNRNTAIMKDDRLTCSEVPNLHSVVPTS